MIYFLFINFFCIYILGYLEYSSKSIQIQYDSGCYNHLRWPVETRHHIPQFLGSLHPHSNCPHLSVFYSNSYPLAGYIFCSPIRFLLCTHYCSVPIDAVAIITGFCSFDFPVAAQNFESIFIVNFYTFFTIDANPLWLHLAEIITAIAVQEITIITDFSFFWFKDSVSTVGNYNFRWTVGREAYRLIQFQFG